MKLAVGIATYQRADGLTKKYLTRALESLKNQLHQDFKLFLIGDRYDNNDEFEHLAKSILPQHQIYFENRNFATERDLYTMGTRQLWCSGGVSAYNHAVDCALSDGYSYVCHLDHDDYWHPGHLSCINAVVEQAKNSALIYTCAQHFDGSILPRNLPVSGSGQVYEYLPKPFDTVHSSVCINHSLIPLRYRDVFAEEGHTVEADVDMWIRIGHFISQNPLLKSYLIGETTCYHVDEQH
jgi:GT2 family glycosyltransferase